jgi:hypothetical protein
MTAEPQQIGRYRIEGTLGRGAMGSVYRAHDPEIDRPVAIKLVHADLLHGEERAAFIARFRREAQAAARCAHPNIVAVYDFALHDGNPFLAMEFVDGMSLAGARGPGERMAPAEACRIIVQVLAGLGAAHATGITHRDIKPANIMLARNGAVKVADFGISRMDTSQLTGEGMLVGTPSYMSPEQCRGETVDPRSDLYSTGVVLFEMLAGARPFAGASAGALYVRLATEDAPDIRTLRPDLPAALAEAVSRSLARDRDQRFPSAAAMAVALAAALGVAVDESAGDGTVVLAARAAAEPTGAGGAGTFDRDVVDTLERKLVEHVGPIARYLVQSAARQAGNLDSLCAVLASKIERPADRDRFAREVKAKLRTGASTAIATAAATFSGGLALTPEELERLQAELTRYLGPVARVLIKRALPKSASVPALWEELASHIESPDDRAAFLRKTARS